jgi:hypothetical protein
MGHCITVTLNLIFGNWTARSMSSQSRLPSLTCLTPSTYTALCWHGTRTTLSDSSIIASMLHSPSVDLNQENATVNEIRNFDPYNANGKETRRDIGCYCSAAEVSWMYVGNEQLEYASGALKMFRFPVKHLA